MSLYKNDVTIGGVRCGMVKRNGGEGGYLALFEREHAALEQIEAIDWARPEITGECVLPAGCGFAVTDISYCWAEGCYKVALKLEDRYLGDVSAYREQIGGLEQAVAAARAEAEAQTELRRGREAELMAAYTEGVNENE